MLITKDEVWQFVIWFIWTFGNMEDRYYLARFKNAQDFGVYEKALQEVKNGRKMSHWMWFIFPQIAGLGHSDTTRFYAIKSAEEAKAYLEDEVLGWRLREICRALMDLDCADPVKIFGTPDWMKLNSCMTLFDNVSPNDIFNQVLRKFFNGKRDTRSLTAIRWQRKGFVI